MAKKIQDGNQIVTNVDSNDNLTFSIKSSFIDSTPTANSTNLVTSGGVKSALDINTTDIDNLEITVGTLSTNVNANTTKIGTLSNLTTTSKTNLVSAINELETDKLETSAVVNEASTDTDKTYSADYLNDKLVSVGTTAPTDGKRVWFEKSRNVLVPKFTNGYTDTNKGITLTYNNGTYRVQGTATSDYFFTIADQNQKDLRAKLLSGKYYLSGAPSGSSNSTYWLQIYGINATGTSLVRTFEEGVRVSNFVNETQNFNISIFVKANQTIDVLFKPQLEEGEITSFEPYINPTINVDGDEIYNLKSQTPQNITLSFNTTYVYSTDLDYICFRLGKLVFLFINTLAFRVGAIADFPNYSNIVSGLPRPAQTKIFYLQPSGNYNRFRANVTTAGNMQRHWSSDPSYGDSANKQYSGFIVYETID